MDLPVTPNIRSGSAAVRGTEDRREFAVTNTTNSASDQHHD